MTNKVGLDDLVAAGASRDDIEALPRSSPPEVGPASWGANLRRDDHRQGHRSMLGGVRRPAVVIAAPGDQVTDGEREVDDLKLADHAYHGLAGQIVKTIAPHSEADPVAILAHILIAVGNVVGRGAHFLVEQTPHALNEYVALVGATAKGRKGMAWSTPKSILRELDSEWTSKRVKTGLSSGEGVIYHVRDAREETQPIKDKGRIVDYQTAVVDQGEADKRLFVIEPEFASVLRRMNSETNTLSAILRQAWDDGDLSTLTKNSPLRATGAHVSIVAHVTREELITSLTETERANGFANRFLFLLVRRSKFLPEGVRSHVNSWLR